MTGAVIFSCWTIEIRTIKDWFVQLDILLMALEINVRLGNTIGLKGAKCLMQSWIQIGFG